MESDCGYINTSEGKDFRVHVSDTVETGSTRERLTMFNSKDNLTTTGIHPKHSQLQMLVSVYRMPWQPQVHWQLWKFQCPNRVAETASFESSTGEKKSLMQFDPKQPTKMIDQWHDIPVQTYKKNITTRRQQSVQYCTYFLFRKNVQLRRQWRCLRRNLIFDFLHIGIQ